MLSTRIYKHDFTLVGDTVALWRDSSAWIAPARVKVVLPHYCKVVHNGRIKTLGMNRKRLIYRATKADSETFRAKQISTDDAYDSNLM